MLRVIKKVVELKSPPVFSLLNPYVDRHLRATENHLRCIERLQYELSRLPPETPYAVDIAAKRLKEPLSVGVYQCGTELQEIKNFLKSPNAKLYPNVEDIDLVAKSKFFVISLRGVEISYGFGKDARRKAFRHAEQILRHRPGCELGLGLENSKIRKP